MWVKLWVRLGDPQLDPHGEMSGKVQRAPDRKFGLPARYSCVLVVRVSHHLAHEIPHGFRRLILHLPGGVGVGTQGEARIVVPQHTGDRFNIHSVLQGQGGEGMPEIVEADVLQSGVLEDLLVEFYHRVRVVHFPGSGRGE